MLSLQQSLDYDQVLEILKKSHINQLQPLTASGIWPQEADHLDVIVHMIKSRYRKTELLWYISHGGIPPSTDWDTIYDTIINSLGEYPYLYLKLVTACFLPFGIIPSPTKYMELLFAVEKTYPDYLEDIVKLACQNNCPPTIDNYLEFMTARPKIWKEFLKYIPQYIQPTYQECVDILFHARQQRRHVPPEYSALAELVP